MGMTRRQLIARLSALAALSAGTGLPGLASARRKRLIPWRNWSGAQQCLPEQRFAPADEQELAEWLAKTLLNVRPVGAGHSFSPVVPTDGAILTLARMQGMIAHDAESQQAEFWGGTAMTTMGPELKAIGQALPNMADIDYQTLAGALATSTHGTGVNFGSYSSNITGMRLITAQGVVIDCDAVNNPEIFSAARVSMGSLGVITRVKLQNRSAFRLHETMSVEKTEDLLENIPSLVADNQHWEMQVVTNSDYAASITLNETDAPITPVEEGASEGGNEFLYWIEKLDKYGSDFPAARHALMNMIAKFASFEERVGESYEIYANVRDVRFNEMEYSVPAEDGPACLREILKLIHEKQLPTWFPIEYRYVKADDIPLSMFEGRDSCSISIHQHYTMSHHEYFSAVEKIFWKYNGRPHWGKLHNLNAQHLSALYPRWKEFTNVRAELDPQGKFLNAHLRSVFGVA